MAVALQHQLTAAGIGGLLKPATGVGATMAGLPTTQAGAAALQLPGDGESSGSTLTLLEPPGTALLHPALRNVKTINIGKACYPQPVPSCYTDKKECERYNVLYLMVVKV